MNPDTKFQKAKNKKRATKNSGQRNEQTDGQR